MKSLPFCCIEFFQKLAETYFMRGKFNNNKLRVNPVLRNSN